MCDGKRRNQPTDTEDRAQTFWPPNREMAQRPAVLSEIKFRTLQSNRSTIIVAMLNKDKSQDGSGVTNMECHAEMQTTAGFRCGGASTEL